MQGAGSSTRVGADPLWTGVLRALRSHPGTALAVSVAVAVASLVAGAAPLFEASVGNEVFRQQLDATDPVDAGLTVTILRGPPDAERLAAFERGMEDHLAGDELGALTRTTDGQANVLDSRLFRTTPTTLVDDQLRLTAASPPPIDEGRRGVRLLAHPGIVDHLDVVWETGGPGLWVPEVVADQLGLEPGDALLYTVELSAAGRVVEPVPFAGVYAEPWLAPDAFWQTLPAVALPNPPSRVVPETQRQVALIGEPDDVLELADRVGEEIRTTWQLPVVDVPTLPDGRRLATRYERFEDTLVTPGAGLREIWEGIGEDQGLTARAPTATTQLEGLLDAASVGRASIAPLLRTLSIAGVALALAVIAVTGAYVTRRRAGQVRLLWSQGVGAVAHGARTSLELFVPVVFGALLGWLGALAAVRLQGPWGALEARWIREAAGAAAIAGAVGLVTLGVVAGVTATATAGARERGGVRGRVVLLTVLAVASAASWIVIRSEGVGAGANPLFQVFPLLVIALAAAVATSLLAVLLHGWSGTVPTVWLDLALQRLRLAAVSTTPLVMAAAVAVGLVVYATGLASSITVSARDKAIAQAGAEISVRVRERVADVPEVPDGAEVIARGRTRSPTTGGTATVLVVDVDALAEGAPWGDGFSNIDLDAVLRDIAVDGPTSPAPVAAAGPRARPLGSTVALDTRAFSVPAEVAVAVDALPGMAETGPTYLIDRRAFARPDPGENIEEVLERQLAGFQVLLWTSSDTATFLPQVTAAGLEPVEVLTAGEQLVTPRLLAHLAATDFVRLLGAIATLVALGALALYGSARQRERVLGYALSRRMGLRPGTHRLAVIAELLALLVLAGAVAIPAALVGLAAVLPALDPQPGVGPPIVVSLPLGGAAVVAGALVAVGIGYGFVLQRQAERTQVAEVLRVSD